ncbi:MAG: hypothetical protein MPI95_05320 [Nitrosopumilus sp.]|nr:hypothetical protein [Nitrosopumilus sp.]CAI9831165.1 conserved hypothetical protein [Nitrosopumilaceae archaeon]MDA7941588.1 hypothetical protein [Nitrosopumilus sp.]MDA7943848.1 hypothetical protein [Nitrosopumilus sp.]MDA7945226.1 hypothetical protein [Nitrosopumilus sp.]
MERHRPADEALREIDAALARLNAMEAANPEQRDVIRMLRMLAAGQAHSIREAEHLKKALDLLTEQIFKIQDRIR